MGPPVEPPPVPDDICIHLNARHAGTNRSMVLDDIFMRSPFECVLVYCAVCFLFCFTKLKIVLFELLKTRRQEIFVYENLGKVLYFCILYFHLSFEATIQFLKQNVCLYL